jgi:Sporulation and spore germination/Immunoglobulin-like domain of bacterial spore germination
MKQRFSTALVAGMLLVSCQPESVPDETTMPSPSTSSAPATTTTTAIPEIEPAVYLFFEGYPVAPGPYLVAVSRAGINDLGGALVALLEGVPEEEGMAGLSTAIPEGTELLGVEVSSGVALVDLSREFESGGGSLSMMGRVAQIVYTATRFEGVDSVRFLLEGTPLDVLGGEGVIIDEPQTRMAWSDLTPPILVDTPSWGSEVGNEIHIAGSAQIDSGTVSYVIVDADGIIISEGAMATNSGAEFGTTVALDEIAHPGLGSIIIWEWIPDGSQQHVLEYPLTLVDQP